MSIEDLRERKSKIPPRKIMILNHKGGCGKSTLAEAVVHRLVAHGNRVLLIDNDPQCNVSQRLGMLRSSDFKDRRVNAFYGNLKYGITERSMFLPVRINSSVLDKYDGALYILGGSKLCAVEAAAAQNIALAERLEIDELINDAMDFYGAYFDYIVIDNGPAMYGNVANELMFKAVCDKYGNAVIPFDGTEAVVGLDQVMNWCIIQAARKYIKPNEKRLRPNGIFVMMKFQKDTKDLIDLQLGSKPWSEAICHIGNRQIYNFQSSVYTAMSEVFGEEYLCRNAIPERRKIKMLTFAGLEKNYPIRTLFEALGDEIIDKTREHRTNLFDLWETNKLDEKLNVLMETIENRRYNNVSYSFTPVRFGDMTKVKRDHNLK